MEVVKFGKTGNSRVVLPFALQLAKIISTGDNSIRIVLIPQIIEYLRFVPDQLDNRDLEVTGNVLSSCLYV